MNDGIAVDVVAATVLGWQASVSLDHGLGKTVSWCRAFVGITESPVTNALAATASE